MCLGCYGVAYWQLHTCVEGRHFAIVARPEVVGLVLCVLGRASVLFVGVILVHIDDVSLYELEMMFLMSLGTTGSGEEL